MTKIIKVIQYGEHALVLETGEIARQADASVMVKMNGTCVFVTVVFIIHIKYNIVSFCRLRPRYISNLNFKFILVTT